MNPFTYADLYADCFRYLGINDPKRIKALTIVEYKALKDGANKRMLDDMERDASLAFQTALAGGFDKDGKPLIRSVKDLFDRDRVERQVDSNTGRRRVKEETIAKFKASKENAEALLNGISVSTNEGEEDVDGD